MACFRRFSRYYLLTLLAIAVVLVLCLMPIEDPPLKDVRFIDKWTHIVLFGGICGVLLFEMTLNGHGRRRWMAPLMAGSLGGVVELLQAYCTACRSGEWLDFVADIVGAFIVYPLALCLLRLYKRH